MMTSSNGNILRVTGSLCGEFTGHRWIPLTQASDAEIWFFSLICAWINGWVNSSEAGDLRRHRAHYDVTLMYIVSLDVIKLWSLRLHIIVWGVINDKSAAVVYIMPWHQLGTKSLSKPIMTHFSDTYIIARPTRVNTYIHIQNLRRLQHRKKVIEDFRERNIYIYILERNNNWIEDISWIFYSMVV